MSVPHLKPNVRPQALALPAKPTDSVVICSYTEQRLDLFIGSLDSVRRQTVPDEAIVVVDYNVNLYNRLIFTVPDAVIVENAGLVGCTYRGMPKVATEVRNFIGANMSFLAEVPNRVGGFKAALGRQDAVPLGCEETELCIRSVPGHRRMPARPQTATLCRAGRPRPGNTRQPGRSVKQTLQSHAPTVAVSAVPTPGSSPNHETLRTGREAADPCLSRRQLRRPWRRGHRC